jgi:hypothetical protein
MPMTHTTIRFTRDGMDQEAAKRQGSSASPFVREAAVAGHDGRR